MADTPECAFCEPKTALEGRIISLTPLVVSFVSDPSFREGHVVVVPRSHVTTFAEAVKNRTEWGAVSAEIARLALRLDDGPGYDVLHKFDPARAGINGVTMAHFHTHVVPRQLDEPGVFAVPPGNSFAEMVEPSQEEIERVLRKTR